MPGLKRHGILLTNSSKVLEEARILKDPSHPGSARITFRPQINLLQKMLQSKHALQFSARYVLTFMLRKYLRRGVLPRNLRGGPYAVVALGSPTIPNTKSNFA